MSLSNLGISLGAATCSVTGGTATTFTPTSRKVNNGGVAVHNAAEVDPRERQVVTAYAKTPVYNPQDAVWSDESREITYSQPVPQADGSVKFRTFRGVWKYEAGISAADLSELRSVTGQLSFDTDLNDFFTSGSMS